MNRAPIAYVPAARTKQGELEALGELAQDVIERIAPRLIIPPLKEPDPQKGRPLSPDEVVHLTGRRIARYWPMRPLFLDAHFLLQSLPNHEISRLPRIFEVARSSGATPTPVATLEEILDGASSLFTQSMGKDTPLRIALRIDSDEIDSDLTGRVREAMSRLQVAPHNCAVILDFARADLSVIDAVASIAVVALEHIQSIGVWNQIIFQGTNYPKSNPAEENTCTSVPRNEWLSWKAATTSDPNVAEHFVFGDYCADSAKFNFKGGGSAPIKHYRYATIENWLVARSRTDVSIEEGMRAVSQMILSSGKFAGRDFSSADEYIYRTATGDARPGNATTWRKINTVHHITRVVSDIGAIRGFKIARHVIREPAQQLDLLAQPLQGPTSESAD